MTLPRHLVTVWNPSYAQDAMDEHLAVLIDWAGRAQAGERLPGLRRFRARLVRTSGRRDRRTGSRPSAWGRSVSTGERWLVTFKAPGGHLVPR